MHWPSNNPITLSSYNDNTWTIPLEYCTSSLLLAVLTCLSYVKTRRRAIALSIMVGTAILHDRWEVSCFFAGTILALCTPLIQLHEASSGAHVDREEHPTTSTWPWLPRIGLVLGLFLLSAPLHDCSVDPFYNWVKSPISSPAYDEAAHVRSLGAALVVWSVLHHEGTRNLLTNKWLLHVGKLSFSFYLVHGPLIRCIYHSALPYIYAWTGDGTYDGQGTLGTLVAWLIGVVLCFPPALLLALVFHRYVETPSIRLSRDMGSVLSMRRKEKGT
jgi:peptidoglycan/LPS O-acetylase OafA/YrhL